MARTASCLTALALAVMAGTTASGERLIVAVGHPDAANPRGHILVMNPQTGSIIATLALARTEPGTGATTTMIYANALDLGRVGARQVAVVVGSGTSPAGSTGLLAVVDMSNAAAPAVMSMITVDGGIDIVLKDDLALVSSTDHVVAVSLIEPTHPQVIGTIQGIGGRLSLGTGANDGLLFGTARSIFGGQDPRGGVRVATLGPAIPIVSIEPRYALINEKDETVEDLKIRCRVVPASSELQSPSMRVVDSRGTVLYEGPVTLPPEGTGEMTLPKGQKVKPTPNFITLEVRNPDGAVSAPTSGGGVLVVQPPVLTDLLKSRVTVGQAPFELVLRGRNFSTGAQAGFAVGAAEPIYQPVQWVSGQDFRTTVPTAVLATVGTVTVTVRAGGLVSNELPIKVVPAGLPPAPSLVSIEPNQVTSGTEAFWLTMRGAGFDPADSRVFADGAGEPLTSQHISSAGIRALVPPGLALMAGRVGFRVESRQDPDVASETRFLEVLDVSGAFPVPPPSITALDPVEVPYVPEGQPAQEVQVKGAGFQSGAQVFATVDGGAPVALATQVKGAKQVTAKVPTDLWSRGFVRATFSFGTTYGQREAERAVDAFTPGIFFTELRNKDAKPVKRILPGTFYNYDLGRYLVDPTTAKATAATFDLDLSSFRVHVREPRALDPATMNVSLISEKADGTVLDSIQKLDTKKGEPRGPIALKKSVLQYYESARRILPVSDAVDDGAVNADGGFTFSANDGAANDQTIQIELGGKLKVIYKDQGFTQEAKVDVCPTGVRLKIPLQVYRVDSVPVSPQQITDAIDGAKKVWAQMCAGLEVAGGIQTIPEPDPTRKIFGQLLDASFAQYVFDTATNTNVFCNHSAYGPSQTPSPLPLPAVCTLPLGQRNTQFFRYNRFALSEPMNRLIAAAPLSGEPALRIVFVEDMRNPNGTQIGDRTGLAITDTGYYEALDPTDGTLKPLSPASTGVLFIATATLSGKQFNGRTVAHELAHALVGEDNGVDASQHAYVRDALGKAVDDQPNILRNARVEDTSVLRKRFNGRQLDLLYRSNRFVRYPPAPVFGGSQ